MYLIMDINPLTSMIDQDRIYPYYTYTIGWFSNRTGTSDDDERASGIVWILF